MSRDRVTREEWIIGVVGVLLLIDLLELPWHTAGGGTVSGIVLPSISDPATGSPDAFLGVLAVLAILAAVLDMVVQHLSPDTHVPAVNNSRSMTRFALALVAAALLALKFLFHLDQISNLGTGFWLGAVLTVMFVYFTTHARHMGPAPPPRTRQEAEEEAMERNEGREAGDAGERDEGRRRGEAREREEGRHGQERHEEPDDRESGDEPQDG